jgi:dienelactone hydrolase
MKKTISLLTAMIMAVMIAFATPAHANNVNLESQRTALASTAQSVMSAVAPTLSSPIRTIRSLATGETTQTYKYHTQSPDEVGDVYYDTDWVGQATKKPAIIVVHGGWWHNATRANSAAMAQKWMSAGFVVFNIDYRVAADHTAYAGSGVTGTVLGSRWPAQRIDVALAYDWLKANAVLFGVDPARVGLYGFSAGGHIVHSASGYYGTSRFQASASVGAVLQPDRTAEIVFNGTYNGDSSSPTLAKSFGYMTSALGCSYEPTWTDCGNKWKSFRPDQYFGADKPAIYAIKGTVDPVEPISALNSWEYWLDYHTQDHVTLSVAGAAHDETVISGSTTADITRWNNLVTWMKAKTA